MTTLPLQQRLVPQHHAQLVVGCTLTQQDFASNHLSCVPQYRSWLLNCLMCLYTSNFASVENLVARAHFALAYQLFQALPASGLRLGIPAARAPWWCKILLQAAFHFVSTNTGTLFCQKLMLSWWNVNCGPFS